MAAQNAFTDMFKGFADISKLPHVDFNNSFVTMRRNVEAATAANQALVEGIHAAARRSAEIARNTAESTLKATRDLMTSGSPEQNTARQAAFVKGAFETSLNNLREVCEMLTKSSMEAFDVVQKRIAESIEETTDTVTTKKSKKNS